MHKKLGMRALALMLAAVMVFGLVPAVSAAPAQTGASAPEAHKTIAEYLEDSRFTLDQVDANAEVEFIVELEDAPLADSIPEGMMLSDYLSTSKGSVQASAIETRQAVMAKAIEACADDLTITHSYRVVLNGFAVQGSYGDRAALEALDGVKRVTIGNVYSVPEPQEAEGDVITSGEMMNSDSVNAEGYTGKGTFSAILDTGLTVDHEAFIPDSVQGAVVTADTIAALEGLTASGNLYKNAKVAFAYDYADQDDDVSDSQGHGTHVAGTVGANGESFRGVAPDTQLAIMKVFGDSGSAYDSDIFAALEDCVILGVDTVNMSLGTPCGFTYEDEATEAVYNAVRAAGVNLMVSAGNDTDSAYGNLLGTDLALAGNPDYGIVGSPSTYSDALSVASVNESLAFASYFLLGEEQISYDENPESALKLGDLEGTYEYVRVGGVGNTNDFAKVDVTGKIALVERGEIAFTEKEQNAYDSGAIAMIVYNNSDVEETVYMQLNGLIPAVFISKAEGKLLKDAETKTVTISADYSGRMPSPAAGEMSDFSSLGVAPDLSLKPEITAPGGNVWSTSASGGYEEMSGTSMAAPHMTGAAAVMQQYVNEAFPGLTDNEKQELIDNLLMSTANPVLDENGVAYTPRKQGAGLANVAAAVHSGAYLTVGGGRPKAELGENEDGTFQFTFTVHNISDSEKIYSVDLIPVVAQTETVYGYESISALCREMTEDELTVTFSAETVTVQPGSTADVTVSLALTEQGKEALSVFTNGIYIEGFVTLTGENAETLGLPYLGFYGDWADAPIFDTTMYDDEASFIVEGAIAMMDYNGSGNYLGINAITGNANENWISYPSRNAGYYMLTPMQGLLRAPKEIWYTAAPANDPENPVYVMAYENTFKSFYYSSGGYIYSDFVPWEDAWQPIGGNDEEGYYYLDDGWYTYTVDARIDGETEYQTIHYPIYIDNQAPSIVSHTYEVVDGTPWLTIEVTDDHYVMAAQLVDEDFTKALSGIVAVEETEQGAVTTLKFDLTEVQEQGYKLCRLDLYDYAWNETISDLLSTTSQDIEPQVVSINEYTVTANIDSSNMEMHAIVDPAGAVNKTLTWSSTDESVAKVVAVSDDTMTAEIDFVGPGSCEIRATAVNGVYGASQVSVSKPTTEWPSDNVIRQDGYYTIPESLNTTVTITDDAHNVWITGAENNTADNPYVNLTLKSENSDLNLTIENLHLKNSANWQYNAGIVFTGTGNTLKLVGENSVAQSDYGSNASISVASGVALTIEGSGKLTVNGNCNAYGASIGGDAGASCGTIVINGGHFVFNSVNQGAGIGGGSNGGDNDITINGGTFEMNVPMAQFGWMWNTTYTGAVIGSGNAASSGTTKITINGGDFTGLTGTGSALIGTGYGSSNNLLIEINDGTFNLVSEDTDTSSLTGGACIGTGQVGYYGTPTADITINGGYIYAVSKSCGAAIGGGPGINTGSIYINGGTVTAIAESEGDAIGAGTAPEATTNNIRISGGTVKAVSTGTGSAFGDDTLVNDDSDSVYLVNIEAPGVTSVTVNGKDWGICANHPEDDLLYLYLPASETAHEVIINGETGYQVCVTPGGDVTVTEFADKTALDEAIASAEGLNEEDYTPGTWEALEEALEKAKAVSADPAATQEEVDDALEALTAAQNGLVLLGDKTELAAYVEYVQLWMSRMAEEAHDSLLWNTTCYALDDSISILLLPDMTQADYDASLAALREAFEALLAYPVNTMYTDVPEGQWYYDAVDFVTRYGFMNGMGNGSFSAGGNMNRAQFVVILYRLAGQPAVNTQNPFVDVPAESWFTDAVLWAYANGITTGSTATTFNPGGTLVRQNMVTFLMRFANVMELDTSARADLSGYTDAGQIQAHAMDAMQWAVAEGIVSGMTATTLGPNALANRAQIATIIQRFVPTYLW